MMRSIVSLVLLAQLCFAAVSVKVVQPDNDTVWIYGRRYNISIDNVPKDITPTRWQVDLMVLGAECNEDFCIKDGPVARIANNRKLTKNLEWQVPSTLAHHGKGFFVQFSNKGKEPFFSSEIFSIQHMGILEDETVAAAPVEKRAIEAAQPGSATQPASHAAASAVVSPLAASVAVMAASFAAMMM